MSDNMKQGDTPLFVIEHLCSDFKPGDKVCGDPNMGDCSCQRLCAGVSKLQRELSDARAEIADHVRWLDEMVADYRLPADPHSASKRVAINTLIHDIRAERDALLMALRGQKIALSLMLDRYSDGAICRIPVNYLRAQAECIDAAIAARKP